MSKLGSPNNCKKGNKELRKKMLGMDVVRTALEDHPAMRAMMLLVSDVMRLPFFVPKCGAD